MRRVAAAAALAVVAIVAAVVVVRQSDEDVPVAAAAAVPAFCDPADLTVSLEQRPLNSAQSVAYLSVRNRGDAPCTVGALLTTRISPGAVGPISVAQARDDAHAQSARDRVTLTPGRRAFATVIVGHTCVPGLTPVASIGVRLVVRTSEWAKPTAASLRIRSCPGGAGLELGSLWPLRSSP